MIIIVEGIDRVGKTTLCERLRDEMNVPIHKNVCKTKYENMDNNYETDKMLQLINICNITDSIVIFDRFHLTDYVYGIIERGYDVHDASVNIADIENSLKEDTILLLVEPTNIDKSSNEHGKDLSKHAKMFDEIYKESKIKNKWKCTYNTINEAILFVRTVISKSV